MDNEKNATMINNRVTNAKWSYMALGVIGSASKVNNFVNSSYDAPCDIVVNE